MFRLFILVIFIIVWLLDVNILIFGMFWLVYNLFLLTYISAAIAHFHPGNPPVTHCETLGVRVSHQVENRCSPQINTNGYRMNRLFSSDDFTWWSHKCYMRWPRQTPLVLLKTRMNILFSTDGSHNWCTWWLRRLPLISPSNIADWIVVFIRCSSNCYTGSCYIHGWSFVQQLGESFVFIQWFHNCCTWWLGDHHSYCGI